ncbi:MAG TPA: DHA2 family efflux MFS transporter permease subunit [Trebonia sp.]|jgi:EmrB/QacA subfamily drug resistance transporter|nr:DHA2 family efflux MFS transporter permease subunit [Trebonia sp.]
MSNPPVSDKRGEWLILATLSLGFFMTLLDLTIVTIAIPDMRTQLHASLAGVGWVTNAYVIVLAVLVITAGRLGDLRGRRALFIVGVAVFTIASAASGLSQTIGELIAARAVQGLGAALLMPQTMAVIVATFPAARRGVAMGIWGGVAGLATIAGPTVGGLLVSSLGWRWIFFVNIPVGVVAVVMAVIFLPEVRSGRRQRLDPVGITLASVALVAITYGLLEGQAYDWDAGIWALIIGGVAVAGAFGWHQKTRQDRDPLLPFGLFADRNYALMGGANMMVSIAMIGMALPLTLFLQTALGYSALKAGLTLAPASIVSGIVAPFAGKFADRAGGYLPAAGFTLYAVGLIVIAVVASVHATPYDFLPGFVLTGLGTGCTMSPMQTNATRNVPPQLAGAASGVLNTLRQTGSALGGAIVLAVLQARLASGTGLEGGGTGAGAGDVMGNEFVGALRAGIVVPVVALLVGAVLCLGLKKPVISGTRRVGARHDHRTPGTGAKVRGGI